MDQGETPRDKDRVTETWKRISDETRTERITKALDAALPQHTKRMYNRLEREEATILAQLRTGCCRLNYYLAKIKAGESNEV